MADPKAVVLLSGGVDSSTTLAIARSEGYRCYALTIRYGQRHEIELRAARSVGERFEVEEHRLLDLDLRQFGGSALTADLDVPKDRDIGGAAAEGIPITYVPARNTIFLSLALAWAEVLEAYDIFIGVNAIDYSGYPDCRPEYISAFQAMANLATRAAVEHHRPVTIHTPLIDLSKAEIIRRGLDLGVDFGITVSCYDPSADGTPCGRCDACALRAEGFEATGITDPGARQHPQ